MLLVQIDHLGSIRTTIDGTTGAVLGYDDYYPFGLAIPGRSSNTGTPNDLNKFTGHERDQEGNLNLDYMLARNYDPEIGRFLSVDPLYNKFPAWSSYNYTFNNPLRLIDPTGMSPDDPFGWLKYAFSQDGTWFGNAYRADQAGEGQLEKKIQSDALDVAIGGTEVISDGATLAEPVLVGSAIAFPEVAPGLIGASRIAASISAVADIAGGLLEKHQAKVNGSDPSKVGNEKIAQGVVSYIVGKTIGIGAERTTNKLVGSSVKEAINSNGAKFISTATGRFVSNFNANMVKNIAPAVASYGASGMAVAAIMSLFGF